MTVTSVTANKRQIGQVGTAHRGVCLTNDVPKIDFSERPFIVIWEVTQACDLVCVYCRACAQSRRSPFELSTTEGKWLIDQIAEM